MNLINKAITEIKFRIPAEILKLAYQDDAPYARAPISIDEKIRRKTIAARVLVDANLVGGDTVLIPLNKMKVVFSDEFNLHYEIPGEVINNRTILSVLSVSYTTYNAAVGNYSPNAGNISPTTSNDLTSAARRAMDAHSSIPVVSSADVEVIGQNTVMLKRHLITSMPAQLRCVVANDDELGNISIRSSADFSKLCELAVKSYIYNTLLIKLDAAFLNRGREMTSIKTYVDGLADAEENYQTYLREHWSGVATMNDRLSYEDLLTIQMDPRI